MRSCNDVFTKPRQGGISPYELHYLVCKQVMLHCPTHFYSFIIASSSQTPLILCVDDEERSEQHLINAADKEVVYLKINQWDLLKKIPKKPTSDYFLLKNHKQRDLGSDVLFEGMRHSLIYEQKPLPSFLFLDLKHFISYFESADKKSPISTTLIEESLIYTTSPLILKPSLMLQPSSPTTSVEKVMNTVLKSLPSNVDEDILCKAPVAEK
ncbi:hypothetical protein YC2023_040791 [Brassica napus]